MILPTRHFSPFKLFLDREAGYALMLNPKVMTTFTRRFLADGYREFRGKDDPSDGRYRPIKLPREVPVAPLAHYLGFLADPAQYRLQAFVRNPYARILSAWRNKFLDGHRATPDGRDAGYPKSVRRRHLGPVRRFARDHSLPGATPGTLVPFETFLAYAASRPEGRRDHHWDSQTSVLLADRLTYDRTFRIEDQREEGFLSVASALGFDRDWALARLERKENPSRSTEGGYTEAMALQVRSLAGDDFRRFGYDPVSWRDVAGGAA
jgi:hypothetical protein